MNFNSNELIKQLYSDGYKLGMKVFVSGFSREKLFSAIEEIHLIIDELTGSITDFAEKQGKKADCKKGCSWCCYQPIFALNYELDYLNWFIGKKFNREKQKEIQERAKQKDDKLSKLEYTGMLNSKSPCPLLENGACIAYEARPVACRIYLSTDLNSCLTFYNDPENKNSFPALLDFPMRAGRMLNEGFKAALKANELLIYEFRIEEKIMENNHENNILN